MYRAFENAFGDTEMTPMNRCVHLRRQSIWSNNNIVWEIENFAQFLVLPSEKSIGHGGEAGSPMAFRVRI